MNRIAFSLILVVLAVVQAVGLQPTEASELMSSVEAPKPRVSVGDLIISTYLGNSSEADDGYDIAVDNRGNIYVVGETWEGDFPVTAGAYDTTHNGHYDAFVAKLSADGKSLIWATYLGGGIYDHGIAIAVDSSYNVYVVGQTNSDDFPTTTGAFDTSYSGGSSDVFVAKLSADGKTLLYSTYLGGSSPSGTTTYEYPYDLEVDAAGRAYVVGLTTSHDYPTTAGAYDQTLDGSEDGFVTKLSADGKTLAYSTYLGGSSFENIQGLAINSSGQVYVTGRVNSTDFPTTAGAYDRSHNGANDVFVTKLKADGSALVWSTFLGGSEKEAGMDIQVGTDGVIVTGSTYSTNFPTSVGAYDTSHNGRNDGFVTKLSADGSALVFSSFIGGEYEEWARQVELDSYGDIILTGDTISPNFPTPGGYDTSHNGSWDGWFGLFNPSGTQLTYATHLGGSNQDTARSVAVDNAGNVYLTGNTRSSNFPTTTGAFDEVLGPFQDAFVVKIQWPMEDTDEDGLFDIWETQGLTVTVGSAKTFVDLPTMGADPDKKDIFVEIDWMKEQGYCVPKIGCAFGHDHKPKAKAIAKVVQAFADAPVGNPDGTTGINLHVDFGSDSPMNGTEKWGKLSQSNSLPHDTVLGSKVGKVYIWDEFQDLKDDHFSQARAAVFHYCIFAHDHDDETTSGISRGIGASDFIVSLGSWNGGNGGTMLQHAGTFMHELGHNLGLKHGGDDDLPNYEPNYLSVMNYAFQMRGLMKDKKEGHYDYSRWDLPDLRESSLNEPVGLNGGAAIDDYGTRYYCGTSDRWPDVANDPIDWDCDGNSAETAIQTDINKDSKIETLRSFNDWPALVYTGGSIGQPGMSIDLPSETETEEITQEENALLTTVYGVSVVAPGNIAALPGTEVEYTFTLANLGIYSDVYTLTVTSSLGWADLSSIPSTLSLSAGASVNYQVPVVIGNAGTDEIVLTAVSQSNPQVEDVAVSRTSAARQVFLPTILRN